MNHIAALGVVALAFLGTSTVALAGDPTAADFDACNKMAQSQVSTPSASVAPQILPQTDAKPPSTATAPQAAPGPQTAAEARVENQANQLRGIGEASKDDPAYQQAYRDCMKGRGF